MIMTTNPLQVLQDSPQDTKKITRQSIGIDTDLQSYGAEVVQFHTRLLRVSLVTEESYSYWQHYRTDISNNLLLGEITKRAFEERWFGSRSMARTQLLIKEFAQRYNAYPAAISVLHRWQPRDPVLRRNLCHWHLQLVDPLYRSFTDTYLLHRRTLPEPTIDRDTVARWASQQTGIEGWAPATLSRMATGLIAATASAGLCSTNIGKRTLEYPQVSDRALEYWLYFLRHLNFAGTLLDNPYWRSVGLTESFLETRLQRLPNILFRRMGELSDFGWKYKNLEGWANGELSDDGDAV